MKTLHLCAATLAAMFAGHAAAQEAPAVSTNFSLTSSYKYRGQDQTDNKPALQGGFDYSNGGFYIGNWNSSIGFTNSGIEMDFYGGYGGNITEGLSYDVGVLQYYYPQRNKVVDPNTTELYGALTFGVATLKYSHTISDDYFGLGGGVINGRNTGYVDLAVDVPVAEGITLNGHLGFTRYSSDLRNVGGLPNYYDYKLGATYDFGSGFSLSGAYVGANKKDFYGDINKGRLILSITKSL